MLSDLILADLQAAIFADPVPGHWDHIFGGMLGKVGHVVIDGVSVVCWPGSKYGMDWIEDIEAIPLDTDALGIGIGTVHAGMIAEVLAAKSQLDKVVSSPVVISGHSLGAFHALLYGAWLTAQGRPPAYILALAPPRGSYQKLWSILEAAEVHFKCCWNAHDRVPELPETLPLFPWRPSPIFTNFAVEPESTDTSKWRYHHLKLYRQGLALAKSGSSSIA